jgi:hypothetical protein
VDKLSGVCPVALPDVVEMPLEELCREKDEDSAEFQPFIELFRTGYACLQCSVPYTSSKLLNLVNSPCVEHVKKKSSYSSIFLFCSGEFCEM